MRLVVLGGGESGVGTAILGQKKGYDVFVSDFGKNKTSTNKFLQIMVSTGMKKHTEALILNAM
jgi:UDP-N-acetylmuramoylalanine--D-glutamate ligase